MIQIRLKLEPKTDCRSVKIIGIKNKIKFLYEKGKRVVSFLKSSIFKIQYDKSEIIPEIKIA